MGAAEQVAETLPFDGGPTSRGSLRDPQPPHSTLPIDGPQTPPRKRKRRGWAPDDTDHLVYQWMKFDGKRQSEVAAMLGINQSTVSRIVMRYEKWQAHATPATDGRLSPEERQRAQRWLTHERNERIIASSLRLAGEMERSIDASRSVSSRSLAEPSAELQMKTEYFVIDRTQMASRFLRLAQKINMDNLKLAEKEPLPELAPLAAEEVAEQVAEATAATLDVEAARAETQANVNQMMRNRVDSEVAQAVAAEVARRLEEIDDAGVAVVGAAAHGDGCSTIRGSLRDPQPPAALGMEDQGGRESIAAKSFPHGGSNSQLIPDPVIRQSNEAAVAVVQVHNVHKMHNCIMPKTGASVDVDESCERNATPGISAGDPCITPSRGRGSPRDTGSPRDPQPPQAGQPCMTTVVREHRPESMRVIPPEERGD